MKSKMLIEVMINIELNKTKMEEDKLVMATSQFQLY